MDIKKNEGKLKLFKLRVSQYQKGLRKYDKRKQYIGTSLSACMGDMLAGFMPLENVAAVVSNTRYRDLKSLMGWRDEDSTGVYESCGTKNDLYCHNLTGEPYPKEDWDKVLDHLLFNCVWIQHRITHGECDNRPINPRTLQDCPHPFEKSLSASTWVAVNKKDLLKWVSNIQKLIK